MRRFEYQIIEVPLSAELMNVLGKAVFGDPLTAQDRVNINKAVVETLNRFGKEGWKLHESGLNTIPSLVLYREKGR